MILSINNPVLSSVCVVYVCVCCLDIFYLGATKIHHKKCNARISIKPELLHHMTNF